MKQKNAPIAIFAYNRKDNLEGLLASLQACHGFEQSPVILFIDGPKGEKDAAQVEAVRAYVRALNWPNLEIVCREKNMGLKQSIFTGVSDVCARYGCAIVLEDDLVLSPVALDYFNEGLEKYESEPRVWSIVGYQYDVPEFKKRDTALMLPFSGSWGWATWARTWSQFDVCRTVPEDCLNSRAFGIAFDVYGLRDFRNMLELAKLKKINSWFICWYYHIFMNGGLCLFPPQSYVRNNGMSNGTHASKINPYSWLIKHTPLSSSLCKFPDNLLIDYMAIDYIYLSRDARVQKLISHLGRLKRLLFKR